LVESAPTQGVQARRRGRRRTDATLPAGDMLAARDSLPPDGTPPVRVRRRGYVDRCARPRCEALHAGRAHADVPRSGTPERRRGCEERCGRRGPGTRLRNAPPALGNRRES